VGRRAVHTHRYAKAVPGHHIQADVKIVSLKSPQGHRVRRFQYTAIDDATRVRALKIYNRHNQNNAIKFIDYAIDKFPFRIHTIRTAGAMSSRLSSTGMSRTGGSGMSTSNPGLLSSMAKWKGLTGQTRRNSINSCRTRTMLISTRNFSNGSGTITAIARTGPSKGKLPTKC
jgi:hypothetical protein